MPDEEVRQVDVFVAFRLSLGMFSRFRRAVLLGCTSLGIMDRRPWLLRESDHISHSISFMHTGQTEHLQIKDCSDQHELVDLIH